MKTQEQFAEEILEQCMNGTSVSNIMAILEEYRTQLASQLEPQVMPTEPEIHSCENCKHFDVYRTGEDEYPQCTAIAYCKKEHWGNGNPQDDYSNWNDCKDFE